MPKKSTSLWGKYQSQIEQTMDMLILHELNGQVIRVNKKACLKSGYSKKELLNMNVFDLHPASVERISILKQWRIWKVGAGSVLQTEFINEDGSKLLMELVTGKVFYDQQELILTLARTIKNNEKIESNLRSVEKR